LGAGLHDHNIDMWYSPETKSIGRLKSQPPVVSQKNPSHSASINISSWDRTYFPQEDPVPADWSCDWASKDDPFWLKALRKAPAGAALEEMFGALGTVGVLPDVAASSFARIVGGSHTSIGVGLSPTDPTTTTTTTTGLPIDIRSPQLRYFTFTFRSTFPLQRGSAGARNSLSGQKASSIGAGPHPHSGMGEMRVDLARRRFFLRGEAANVSSGIPKVESRIVFRGDRDRLYSRTKIESEDFQQCWSVSTAEALPPPRGGAQPNPFTIARDTGAGLMRVGSRNALKHVLYLGPRRRAELFIDEDFKSLLAMNIHDDERDVSTGILVHDWSTAPISEDWFNPGTEWSCDEAKSVNFAAGLAKWDIMQVFFPPDAALAGRYAPSRELAEGQLPLERGLFSV